MAAADVIHLSAIKGRPDAVPLTATAPSLMNYKLTCRNHVTPMFPQQSILIITIRKIMDNGVNQID